MHNHNSTVLANTSSTRRLLPAVAPQTFHRAPPVNTGPLLPRRKAHSTAACETCRKRKVKCNAGRPACGYCVSASIKCVYTTVSANETHSQALKRKLSELNGRETTYRQVFEHLRSRPESEAAEIVKRIQGGAEPESILRYIREGDLLLQLALAPETRYRYVFPLVQEMPEFLVRPDNPYLNSWVYEWMATGAPASRHLALSSQPRGVEMQSTHCKPYHAAELVDPLLNNVKPSEWTTVCSDDNLMRKMLANYFLGEYHWFPAFQKDYFLQDMAAGRHGYCSSLLVNTVLVLGSMATNELSERYEYWNPRNHGYQFLAEAKRLWEIETMSSRVRLTTIQASVLLHLTNVMNAIDAVGSTYTEKAVDMAHRIKLFGPNDTIQDTKRRTARVFTAWALFNWQSMLSYAHFSTPLLKSPPASALPDPSADPEWYGQVWVRYPLDPKLYTTSFPLQFKAQSDSRALLNEASLDKQRVDNGDAGAALPAINRLYSRMKEWHDNLPEPLTPARISLPSQLMLHINYHNIIINLYEPICGTEQADHPISASQSNGSHAPTPVEIRDASARHFETLLRLYYLRHGYDHGDTYVGKCLVQLGFMTLKRMGSLSIPNGTTTPPCPSTAPTLAQTLRTLRSTLLLTGQGLHAQGASYFLPKAILRTLRAKMPPAEQLLLGQVIGDTGEQAEPGVVAQMRQIRSRVLPSAISFEDDPEVHRLGHLVKELGLGDAKGEEGEGEGEGVGDGFREE